MAGGCPEFVSMTVVGTDLAFLPAWVSGLELFDAIAIENGQSCAWPVMEDPGTFGENKPSPGLTASVFTNVDETNGGDAS